MKQVSLEKLFSESIYFENIAAVNMAPKLNIYKSVSRDRNGFLYLLEGKIKYTFNNKSFDAESGALISLPKGSKHIYKALSKKVRYIRLDFETYTSITNEFVVFENEPQLVLEKAESNLENLLLELCTLSLKNNLFDTFKIKSKLFEFFHLLTKAIKKQNYRSGNFILLVIDYINENYSSKISEEALCRLSNVSPTHLRREFKKYTGMTITKYINKQRINKATYLLANDEMPILDIALNCGFSDAEYFCRVFKTYIGINPNKYRKISKQGL